MLKKLARSKTILNCTGSMLASYLRFVRRTSTLEKDPHDLHDRLAKLKPFIVAMWHGQHFMMPFSRPDGWDVRVMISRSADGEINAIAASKLGLGLIRASGAQKQHQIQKRGGMRGFIEAIRSLNEGGSVALTADIPKGPSRVSGEGIIQLAKHSGRPIVPMAIATSRHFELNTWDRSTVNLPFSRIGLALGTPLSVPSDADAELIESMRDQLTDELQMTTNRAYSTAKSGN